MLTLFIPAIAGVIFLAMYTQEKDDLFKWLFFFFGLSFLTASFFMNAEISTVTVANGISTYAYQPDGLLESMGYGFGIVAFVLFVLVAIRMLITYLEKAWR